MDFTDAFLLWRTAAQNLRTCTHGMYGRKNTGLGQDCGSIDLFHLLNRASLPREGASKLQTGPAQN